MGAGGDRTNNTEGRVFLERDAMVAATRVRAEPLDAGHEFEDSQLLDLVVKAANFSFFKFDAPPSLGVGVSHRFDDFDNFHASSDTLLLKLQERFVRCGTSFIGISKHAKL